MSLYGLHRIAAAMRCVLGIGIKLKEKRGMDPDFVTWWGQNFLSQKMMNKSIINIAASAWEGSKKKYQPPAPTTGVTTGQSSLGIPGRDEES